MKKTRKGKSGRKRAAVRDLSASKAGAVKGGALSKYGRVDHK